MIKIVVGVLVDDRLNGIDGTTRLLGVVISDLTATERAAVGVEFGVRVDDVEPGKPAAMTGLKRNDIIVSFNHRPINNVDDLIKHGGRIEPGSTIPLLIQRHRRTRFLALTMPAKATG